MSNFFSTWKPALGFVLGGVVGFIFGCCFGIGWGLLEKWMNPNDPSAGAVAIMVIVTAPLGCLAGAIAGTLVGFRCKTKSEINSVKPSSLKEN